MAQSEGSGRMREASPRQGRAETHALAISAVWLLCTQLACVLLWDAGWLSRQAALIHWLIVGVLPLALVLWRLEQLARAS